MCLFVVNHTSLHNLTIFTENLLQTNIVDALWQVTNVHSKTRFKHARGEREGGGGEFGNDLRGAALFTIDATGTKDGSFPSFLALFTSSLVYQTSHPYRCPKSPKLAIYFATRSGPFKFHKIIKLLHYFMNYCTI